MAGVVACGDWGGRGGDAEVVRPVVLNEEGAVLTNDVEDLPCAFGRPLSAGGVGVGRLSVEQACAGLVEGSSQLVGVRPVGAGRDGNDADPGLRGGGDGSPVRGGFQEQRLPGGHQGPKDGAEPTLASRQHDDVAGRGCRDANWAGGAKLVREPRLQLRQPRYRWTRQGGVAAHRSGQGRPHEALGQQLAVGVARVQRDDVVGRASHGGRDSHTGRPRLEGRSLPAVVRRPRRPHRTDEGPHAGSALDEAECREIAQRLLDGHRAGPVLGDQRAGGRQSRAGRRSGYPVTQHGGDARTAIVVHDTE